MTWSQLSVSYPRIEPSSPLAQIDDILVGPDFQYPTLGSNHLHPSRSPRAPRKLRTFQYPTLGSNHLHNAFGLAGGRATDAFSILPSDRTIFTLPPACAQGRDSGFQYPTLGSNHLHHRSSSVAGLFWRFQYPTLGSNHLHPSLSCPLGDGSSSFSILPSDRTIFTGPGRIGRRPVPQSFSILPSDRTIFTPSRRRCGW